MPNLPGGTPHRPHPAEAGGEGAPVLSPDFPVGWGMPSPTPPPTEAPLLPPPPPPAAPAERADKPPLPLSASVWAPRGRRKLQVRARAQLQGPGPTLHPDPTPPHPGADSSGSRELGRGSQWTIRTLANFENTGLRPAMGGKFGVLPAVGVQGFRHYGPMRTRPGLVGGTVPRDWHERGGGGNTPTGPAAPFTAAQRRRQPNPRRLAGPRLADPWGSTTQPRKGTKRERQPRKTLGSSD